MWIYLDNCCYGRPYDKQDSDKIIDETMSLIKVCKNISDKNIELATSYILHYENNKKNDIDIKTKIFEFMKNNRSVHVGIEQRYFRIFKDSQPRIKINRICCRTRRIFYFPQLLPNLIENSARKL